MEQNKPQMYPELENYVSSVVASLDAIPAGRKEKLEKVSEYVRNQRADGKSSNLIFVCTHNSRRSHLSQIWAATAANYYGLEHVKTYSGGTEATAFNPRAVKAVENAGFKVTNPGGTNPKYLVTYAENAPAMVCFSKKYDDAFNPHAHFASVMTCSDADENCPFIPGTDLRVPITYVDPKEADDTSEEAARYAERCHQIATEMFYLMSKV